jgi:hypothetical protein
MGHKFVWGNTLDFFLNSDVNIINLETSITSTTLPSCAFFEE